MSKLEELIQELCPGGIEYRKFEEVATIVRGGSPRPISSYITEDADGVNWIKIGDVKKNGKYITSTEEKITIDGAKKSRIVRIGDFVLSNSMSFGRPYILKIDGCIHDGWLAISDFSNYLSADFLYHLLCSNTIQMEMKKRASNGTVQNLNAEIVKSLIIPLPPLPVQEEIVRILDKFTALEAELEAELEARKKQYEYYREELISRRDNAEWKSLGEIALDMYRGSGIKRDQVTSSGTPCVRYGELYTVFGVWFDKCVSYTDAHKIQSKKYFDYGDVLFAITGEKVEEIAKSSVYVGHEKCLVGGDIVVLKHNENPKYIAFALSTRNSQEQKSKGKVKSKVVHSSIPALKEIMLPVPALEEQARIASILDRFDTLVNDITQGLPAELAARRRQYEYYRDKLLTFKEKVS